jgi:small subunit ribosomal protein S21
VRIVVVDNQIEAALKQLKKQMLKDGLYQEMKKRAYYEKPSVKRKRKSAQARKKRLKDSVSELLADPERFNGQRVMVSGTISSFREGATSRGSRYYTFDLSDGTETDVEGDGQRRLIMWGTLKEGGQKFVIEYLPLDR